MDAVLFLGICGVVNVACTPSYVGLGSALPIISNRRNLTRRVHGMYTGKEMAALWLTTGQETAATVAMRIVLGEGDTLWFSRFREKKKAF